MELTPRNKDKRRIFSAALMSDGVSARTPAIRVEATFPGGTKLVTAHQLIA